jgi:hypothetical protein
VAAKAGSGSRGRGVVWLIGYEAWGAGVGEGVGVSVGAGVDASVGGSAGVSVGVGSGVGVSIAVGVGVGVSVGRTTSTCIPPESCDVNDADVVPNALKRRSPAVARRPRRYCLPSPHGRTEVDVPVASLFPAERRVRRMIDWSSPTMRKPPLPTSRRKNTSG